jgi:hypothetical protein
VAMPVGTPVPGFVTGSAATRSPRFDARKTINLYPEIGKDSFGKNVAYLVGTPGKRRLVTLSDAPARGGIKVNATTAIVVAGSTVYRLSNLWVPTVIGTISAGTTPVFMASNGVGGNTIMLVTGATGYFINLTTFAVTQIVDPDFFGADRVDFINGYFVFNKPGTQQFQVTTLYGTGIDPLDFASAEGSPDLLVSQIVDHEEYWAFGETSTQVFSDEGGTGFPLTAIQGSFIEQGCAAKNSVAKMDNSLFWLTSDERGQGTVVQTNGYVPTRVSDHALEFAIQAMPYIADAVAYTYQQEGHYFYVLTFPTGRQTWAYDTTTKEWCQRAWRDPATGARKQDRAIFHFAFAGENVVGDWQNGKLYALDLDYYTDDGDLIEAVRQSPHQSNGMNWTRFWWFWLDAQMGVGLNIGQGSDPVVTLEWSDDGGEVFGNLQTGKLGKMGERKARAIFRRLGKSRDRVWRVSITDPVKRVLVDARVHAETLAA